MSFFDNILSLFKSKGNVIPDTFKGNVWSDEEVAEFKKSLSLVIGWSRKLSEGFDYENGSYERVFRSTNPEIGGVKLYSFKEGFHGDGVYWNLDPWEENIYRALLRSAIDSREKIYDQDLRDIETLGKVISFQTCISTHDGAPTVASRGFVDESDVPPIDTWFFLKKNYYHSDNRICDLALFCWIPKEFEGVMQDTKDVEILDSYKWLYLNDPDMQEKIKVNNNTNS